MHISSNITPEAKHKISNNLYFVRGLAIFLVVVGNTLEIKMKVQVYVNYTSKIYLF